MINLKKFWRDDEGQDLIEYTLLLAFVCLAAAAIFITTGQTLQGIWATANTVISNANVCAAQS